MSKILNNIRKSAQYRVKLIPPYPRHVEIRT